MARDHPVHPDRIEVPNRRDGESGSLARGFFVWNSEVGDKSLGLAFFLFDYVCMNRIIWGASEYQEMRLRHTVSAPGRWLDEAQPILTEYANGAAKPIELQIEAAQNERVDDVSAFLSRRFSKKHSDLMEAIHKEEEGRPIETLWDITTAATAHARTLPHQNVRVAIEREAGKVFSLAA